MNVIASGKAAGRHRVARRTDGHQPRRAARPSWACPSSAPTREAIDNGGGPRLLREDHGRSCGIPQPEAEAVTNIEDGRQGRQRASAIRCWCVRATCWAAAPCRSSRTRSCLRHYLQTAVEIDVDQPVLVDQLYHGQGAGGGRHLRRQGGLHPRHHGACRAHGCPLGRLDQRLSDLQREPEGQGQRSSTIRSSWACGSVSSACTTSSSSSPSEDDVYVIEVNPRSSRTVPFLSKSTGVPMAHIATQVILGKSLREQGITEVYGREKERWYVKAPAFSFAKIRGMDSYLSPEMKSTGEAIGYDDKLTRALYKALQATGMHVSNYGTIFVTHRRPRQGAGASAGEAGSTTWASTSRRRPGPPSSCGRTASAPVRAASSTRAATRSSRRCVRGMSAT